MACARESIAALTGEQKKLRKQKVPGVWESGFERPQQEGAGGGLGAGSSGHKSPVTSLNSFTSLCLSYSSVRWE